MILEIRWSLEAEITFDKIYQFVNEQWGLDQAEKLRFKMLDTLNQIAKHPHSFKESEIKDIRKLSYPSKPHCFTKFYRNLYC